MTEDILKSFTDDLLGLYHNRFQAYSNPSDWAFICVKFYIEDDVLKSKSWHNVDGEQSAYRIFSHTLSVSNESVIMTNYTKVEQHQTCNLIFNKDGEWWKSSSDCMMQEKNMYIRTYITFNGKEYHSRDAGYDMITHQFLWGKQPSDGEFIFIKE
jgi:hypothetical protein